MAKNSTTYANETENNHLNQNYLAVSDKISTHIESTILKDDFSRPEKMGAEEGSKPTKDKVNLSEPMKRMLKNTKEVFIENNLENCKQNVFDWIWSVTNCKDSKFTDSVSEDADKYGKVDDLNAAVESPVKRLRSSSNLFNDL